MIAESFRNDQVKKYLCSLYCQEDSNLTFARENSTQKQLKAIAVPPNVGKMLELLCRIVRPKKVLEIGTLGGYSTLWIARGLDPHARLITIEREADRAAVAKENFEKAGVLHQIEVRVGHAEEILKKMAHDKEDPFDLIFIDAHKQSYSVFLDLVLSVSKVGTLLIWDNLIPKRGPIGAPDPRDRDALAIYAFNQILSSHPRLCALPFPTLQEDGRIDAIGVARVES